MQYCWVIFSIISTTFFSLKGSPCTHAISRSTLSSIPLLQDQSFCVYPHCLRFTCSSLTITSTNGGIKSWWVFFLISLRGYFINILTDLCSYCSIGWCWLVNTHSKYDFLWLVFIMELYHALSTPNRWYSSLVFHLAGLSSSHKNSWCVRFQSLVIYWWTHQLHS